MALLAALGTAAPACSGPGPEEGSARAAENRGGRLDVVEGMTMEQVLSIWGTPNVRVREGDGERWHYWLRDERHRVVSKTYVFFDERKRVLDVITQPGEHVPKPKLSPVRVTRAGETRPGWPPRSRDG